MKFPFVLTFILAACCAVAAQKANVVSIEVEADADFMYLPISVSSKGVDLKISKADGAVIFNEPVMLGAGKGDWYAPIDVSAYKNQKLTISYAAGGLVGSPTILTSDRLFMRDFGADRGRPKFHIAATNGVLGASSGLFSFGGKYYAAVLQNEKLMSRAGGFAPMLWESADMVNWKAVDAPWLVKSRIKAPAGAFADIANRSGLFDGGGGGVVFACTDAQNKTFIAYSKDLKSIEYFNGGAPVLPGGGLWPQIFFNEHSRLWTLVRTESVDGKTARAAIYTSKDLAKWELADTAFEEIGNFNANLARVDVLGAGSDAKWIILAGDGRYIVGDFDGKKFTRITAKPLRIFTGSLNFLQLWSNAPRGEVWATATLMQPIPIIMHIKQHFINTLSLPWKLHLARADGGELQLRASVADPFMRHLGVGADVIGGSMTFASNTFVVPGAYGNYCLYDGVFETTPNNTTAVILEVGVGAFGHAQGDSSYFLRRLAMDLETVKSPIKRRTAIIPFKAFVDSYSAEVVWYSGDIVQMLGDSFLNPEQTIKVGAVGELRIAKLDKYPVFVRKVSELRDAIIKIFRSDNKEKREK